LKRLSLQAVGVVELFMAVAVALAVLSMKQNQTLLVLS
jgi:hypothetical protein